MEINLEALSDRGGSNHFDQSNPASGLSAPSPRADCGGESESGDCHEGGPGLYNDGDQLESQPALNDFTLISFSLDDARKLVAERDRLLREYEEVNKKVEALLILVPHHTRDKILGSRTLTGSGSAHGTSHASGSGVVIPAAPPRPSLGDAIVDMLDECLEVMSQDQIEEAVWDVPDFTDKEKFNVEEIARALEKLARRGRITKRGMNYCSKNVAADGNSLYSGPTIIQATEDLLRKSEDGLEAWEVMNRLRNDPAIGDRVKQRPNGVYAALSRLISRRIAYRDNTGAYSIASK